MKTHRTGLSAAIALMVTGLFVTPALASDRHGGDLTVAITGETIDTFDPLFGNRPTTEGAYMNLFYDTLVTLNKDGTYGPGLASSFEVDADTGNIVFAIRDGVAFHDGTALDGEAVAWNLRRVTDPDAGGRWAESLSPISSIEVTGPMEVSIALSEPSPFVLFTLASSAGMMVSPAFVDENGPEALGRQAMGTGPFVFGEIQDGVGVTATRNEAYWMTADNGDALPYLDSVNVRFIPQSSVALLELRTGNIAAIQDVSPNDFETVEGEESLRLIDTGKGAASHINFNHTLPPFDNVAVRRAVQHGIDREGTCRAVLGDYCVVIPGLLGKAEWAYTEDLDLPAYDPQASCNVLEEAGIETPLAVDMTIIRREPDTQIAEIVQAQLNQACFNVNLMVQERTTAVDAMRNLQHQFALAQYSTSLDPHGTLGAAYGTGGPRNRSGISYDDTDALIAQAISIVDQAERKQLYQQVQEHAIDRVYFGSLFWRPRPSAASTQIGNADDLPLAADGNWEIGHWYLADGV